MEFTIIHSMYRYPSIPPIDLWYGGALFNVYYYYGYWIFASAGSLLRIPPQILFNLVLPTICALSAVNVIGIGRLLLQKLSALPLLIFILPNIALIYYFIIGFGVVDSFNKSILLIPGTDNEYLLSSILLGDIHPHVISFFVQTLLLLLLIASYQRWNSCSITQKILYVVFISLSLGCLFPLNSWGIFAYGPLTIMTGVLIAYQRFKNDESANYQVIYPQIIKAVKKPDILAPIILFSLIIPLISMALYIPYYLQYSAQHLSLAWVHTPSPESAFLLMWGFMIVLTFFIYRKEIKNFPYPFLLLIPGFLSGYGAATICLICIIYALLRRREYLDLLLCFGFFLIFICEFLYLNDNLIAFNYRFNTVFKLYSMSWILIGISTLVYLGKELENNQWVYSRGKFVHSFLILILIAGLVGTIPVTITLWGVSDTPGLRGDSFLKFSAPEDYQAILFLRNLTGNYCLVETSDFYGDDKYHGKISTFSGIPSIIGQYQHEILWRSHLEGDEGINQRIMSVRLIYEKPELTVPLMDLNGANLLYVGPLERKYYLVNISNEGLKKIYSADNVTIFRRTSDTSTFPEGWNGSVLVSFPNLDELNKKISQGFQKFAF